jgi:hypothetical protein
VDRYEIRIEAAEHINDGDAKAEGRQGKARETPAGPLGCDTHDEMMNPVQTMATKLRRRMKS